MKRPILYAIPFALFCAVAHAAPLCAPDFQYKTDMGHGQGQVMRGALKKTFQSVKANDFDAFMAIASEPYIQHSPDLPDGWKPVWDLTSTRAAGFTSTQMQWVGPGGMLDNGSYMMMMRVVGRGGGMPDKKKFDLMWFDAGGLYAEHWDMAQPLAEQTVSGRSETDAAAQFTDAPVAYDMATEEANKQLVVSFLNLAFNGAEPQAATQVYVAKDLVQHSPKLADGAAAMAIGVAAACYDIKVVIAQNDLVFAFSKVITDGVDTAVVNLMRVRDAQIVEHWDAVQTVPADADMPHDNGMF